LKKCANEANAAKLAAEAAAGKVEAARTKPRRGAATPNRREGSHGYSCSSDFSRRLDRSIWVSPRGNIDHFNEDGPAEDSIYWGLGGDAGCRADGEMRSPAEAAGPDARANGDVTGSP
jgi:hypothetical protein